MADHGLEPLASDLQNLEKLAEFNAQDGNTHYSTPHYGSPAPAMSPYSYPDPAQMHNVYTSTPNTTPSSPHTSLSVRTTRSGRPLNSDPLGPRPAGVQKRSSSRQPRPKPKAKPKKKKKERTEPPTVFEPLTALLNYMDPKLDADIEAYVNRSVETRLAEVEGSKKKQIKRPMNAFMLYRKGWQNRIKLMQSNENHQGVSRVAGDGWALEPDDIREQYNLWSEIERDMHAQAFPDYKFKPQKSTKGRIKAEAVSDAEETDLEDDWSGLPSTGGKRVYVANDDPDDEYHPPGRVSSRNYAYQHPVAPSRTMSHSPYQQSPYQHHSSPPMQNMSHYQYSNPHQPLPNPYPATGSGHYHAQRIDMQQHHMPPHPHASYTMAPPPYQTENVYYHRTETPSHQYMSPPVQQHSRLYPQPAEFGQSSRSRHATPAPGYHQYTSHPPQQQQQQRHHYNEVPFPEDEFYAYGPPPPQQQPVTTSSIDGADNFAVAMGEMGELGDFGDQFQLVPTDNDPAYELNFSIGDGTDVLDPQLLDSNVWTAEPLPLDALHRPDDFLEQDTKSVVVAAPELSNTPVSVKSLVSPSTALAPPAAAANEPPSHPTDAATS